MTKRNAPSDAKPDAPKLLDDESRNSPESLFEVVPPAFRERFAEIVERIDEFCDRHLNEEYRDVGTKLAAHVCQEGSPVLTGKPASWACGVMYCVGRINFLSDPARTPHMKPDEMAAGFGVSPATMYGKSRTIWDGLELMQFDPDFMIAANAERNPLVWMFETTKGFLIDVRDAPREVQVALYERGLIPFVPADREKQEATGGSERERRRPPR